ncbi:hypothetical protein SAMN05421687_106154 [Salimicrobium flavidum]|uniref:Uncharacterized protein n=1 Tax=Salimicrobium flavidum TaxID=570947 RepID=A0A1N7JJE7_9BACI|nr:hypothetical protein SAMN05421687_106154 [Salimicrobium flavidum]
MVNILFIVNLIANFFLFSALVKPLFNMLFSVSNLLPQIFWIILVVGLSLATSIYTFRYLRKIES